MAGEDPEARAKVMESAKALADICSRIRGERGIRRVQSFLVPVVSFACSVHPNFRSPLTDVHYRDVFINSCT